MAPVATRTRAHVGRTGTTLSGALQEAVTSGDPTALDALGGLEPLDERDELMTLLAIYDLWTAPLWVTEGAERYQSHPAVAAVKWRLEERFVERLEARTERTPVAPTEAVAAMRRVAASGLVPPVYSWLAEEATWSELVAFLAIEGGPDAGFDDLVATVQIGIHDGPKVALARNYWDELGRGTLAEVHTVLHDQLVEATKMPRVPRAEQPVSGLERVAIGGLLATNRRFQPEMLGALGLLELQAGPRCRAVVQALTRLHAPDGAFPFYREHATADPRHGKEWLDEVVAPLAEQHPEWALRMVTGACWRHEVNVRFFAEARLFTGG